MNVEWVRSRCMRLQGATEGVQWGDHLVFKVAGKLFAITAFEPGPTVLTLKSTPEEFAELVERPGIIPAPYLARSHWIALESFDAVGGAELGELIDRSYALVVAKLPKKVREGIG